MCILPELFLKEKNVSFETSTKRNQSEPIIFFHRPQQKLYQQLVTLAEIPKPIIRQFLTIHSRFN
jgi:hypothetical protein